MNGIIVLTIISIVVQFLIERLKVFIPDNRKAHTIPVIASIIGVSLSWGTGIGLFSVIGIPLAPVFMDYIITGVAFSSGSSAFNELVKLITETRPSNR